MNIKYPNIDDMKKTILFAIAALCLCGCSSDDETQTGGAPETGVEELRQYFVGSFQGARYSSVLNVTDHEDIVFRPFTKPTDIVSLYGSFTAYGVAQVCRYVNDHKDTPSYAKRCLYTFGTGTRNERTLSFYPCVENTEVTGSEDRRIIGSRSETSFTMYNYGETADNALTYNKTTE